MIADIARELGPFWFPMAYLVFLAIAGLTQEKWKKK